MESVEGYKFDSNMWTEGEERASYMTVVAYGDKLGNLCNLVNDNLAVKLRTDVPQEFGISVEFEGEMKGVDYRVILAIGEYETEFGGWIHNAEIRSPLESVDRLSLIIEKRMREYEVEMMKHIAEVSGKETEAEH